MKPELVFKEAVGNFCRKKSSINIKHLWYLLHFF